MAELKSELKFAVDFKVRERIPTRIFTVAEESSVAVAREIAALIRSGKKPVVLGLATGSTPTKVYDELIRMHKEEKLSFKDVVTFNLDEYLPTEPGNLQSYHRFMKESLFDHIDIDLANTHIPDGTLPIEQAEDFCRKYEAMIEEVGGIDIQLLGIGSAGHIGFNEPGTHPDSKTRPIYLDKYTRADAASEFFGSNNVPFQSITMGVGTIMKARRIILMALGEGKARIIYRTVEEPRSDQVAASHLQAHPNAVVMLDVAAAAQLTCIRCPWILTGGNSLITSEFSNPELLRKAVIWLSLEIKKPILRLEESDYREHHLAQLIDMYKGRVHQLNLGVYHFLHKAVTGWPGGRTAEKASSGPFNHPTLAGETTNYDPNLVPKKKVLVFSPHPDDDVISMGGTLIRLCDQGHEVHTVYETSGNIAVFDDEAVRFTHYVIDHLHAFGGAQAEIDKAEALKTRIEKHIAAKCAANGWVDSPEMLDVKGIIRRNEAISASKFCGVLEKNVHLLNLPFYQTGKIQKNPITEVDVKIVRDLLQQVKPQQIYAAGDLSDPHGTHRMCLKAVLHALDELKGEEWVKNCEIWLYRGAWQDWEPEKVEMVVPMSPDELYRKRLAIFRHQSQKDPPAFPGTDPREFWQRSEARNKACAKMFDSLGLPEFEACESFVRYNPYDPKNKVYLN